jgi:hypothetical protein
MPSRERLKPKRHTREEEEEEMRWTQSKGNNIY